MRASIGLVGGFVRALVGGVVTLLAAACGARTDLDLGLGTAGGGDDDGSAPQPDSGSERTCGAPPTAGAAGEFNATLCTDPSQCDDFGGAHVCACAGAASPAICGFEAIHDDGHIFTSQCDPSTGRCECILDGNACTCTGSTHPAGLCTLGSPLNCCFST